MEAKQHAPKSMDQQTNQRGNQRRGDNHNKITYSIVLIQAFFLGRGSQASIRAFRGSETLYAGMTAKQTLPGVVTSCPQEHKYNKGQH